MCLFFDIHKSAGIHCPPSFILFVFFLDTQVAELKKKHDWFAGRRFSESLFWPHPSLVEPKEPISIKNTGSKTYKTRAHRKKQTRKTQNNQNLSNSRFWLMLFAVFVFFVFVVLYGESCGLLLAILCFDCVFVFCFVLHFCWNQLSLLKPVTDYKGKWTEFCVSNQI